MQASSTSQPFFGHTNVSKPQLQHTASTHSATASEDYYSLSSSNHSDDSAPPLPIRRYQTPPSRYRTPMASRERLDQPTSVAPAQQWSGPMKGPGRRRHSDADQQSLPSPLQSNPRSSGLARKPVPSSYFDGSSPSTVRISGSSLSSAARELGPPSPGDDDTNYIHFALDQLTRDEEVRGSRVYPGDKHFSRPIRDSHDTVRPSFIPVSPLEPEDYAQPRDSSVSFLEPSPLIDEEKTQPEQLDPSYAVGVAGAAAELDGQPVEAPSAGRPVSNSIQLFPPAVPPKSIARADQDASHTRKSPPETFLPFELPSGISYLTLDALPTLLKARWLALFIVALALYLAALIFTAIWSVVNGRLWAYKSFADGRYFVFQYLPLIIAMALLMWTIQIQIAVSRVAPFLGLASESAKVRSKAALLPLHPSGFLLPSLAYLTSGQLAIAFFTFFSWASLFVIPLLSASFNVYQFGSTWMWLATQGVIWVVIALYVFLLFSALVLFWYLRGRQSGLKWDARSLADQIVLLERSNALDSFVSYFYSDSEYAFRDDIAAHGDRLGYWRTSTRPNAAIHTLGRPGYPSRQYNMVNGMLLEDQRPSQRLAGNNVDIESGQRYSHGTGRSLLSPRFSHQSNRTPNTAKSYSPLVLRHSVAMVLDATFIALLVAFLVVSYLPATAIKNGFVPHLPIPVNTAGFSSTNFLFSFIPSLLGLLVFLLWTHVDLNLRRLQPIANMSKSDGAKGEHSLLLTYAADAPILVSLKAVINRDFRVAVVSTVALLSAALPILGGGVFWAQFFVPTQSVRVSADMPAFYALTAFFAISCIGFLALPLTARQSRPYQVPSPEGSAKANHANSVVDIVALVHQSRLLIDHMFHAPASRIQLVTRVLTGSGNGQLAHIKAGNNNSPSRVALVDSIRGFGDARSGFEQTAGEQRYKLGQYVGRDGRTYVGIDRTSRMLTESEKQTEVGNERA